MSRRTIGRASWPVAAAIALLSAAATAATAEEASHTFLLNLAAGPTWRSEAAADPELVSRILASAAYRYRTLLGGSGFAAVSTSAEALIEDASSLEARQSLSLESRLHTGPGAFDGLLGLRTSFFGDEPYVLANGRLGYRLEGGGPTPAAWLVGSLDVEPEGTEDLASVGLRVGLLGDRSVRLGFDLIAEGVVESWYESDLYTGSGTPSGDKRWDLVTALQIKAGGLAGYFMEWEVGVRGTGRFSTANRLLGPGLVDADSESRLSVTGRAAISWNPHRRLAIELALTGGRTWYLGREALTDTGAATGDKLSTLDCAGSLRIDWSLGSNAYLVLEGEAGGTLANDAAEETWSAELRAGIQIAL